MTGPAGDLGPEPAPAARPADQGPRAANPCPAGNPSPARSSSPALLLSLQRWSERDRRRPDDGVLAPQQRYPGRIVTP
jgi:hypothetical protein